MVTIQEEEERGRPEWMINFVARSQERTSILSLPCGVYLTNQSIMKSGSYVITPPCKGIGSGIDFSSSGRFGQSLFNFLYLEFCCLYVAPHFSTGPGHFLLVSGPLLP